jgi:hypothetical protein
MTAVSVPPRPKGPLSDAATTPPEFQNPNFPERQPPPQLHHSDASRAVPPPVHQSDNLSANPGQGMGGVMRLDGSADWGAGVGGGVGIRGNNTKGLLTSSAKALLDASLMLGEV